MDPESEVQAQLYFSNLSLNIAGWYHSHPTFDPNPSIRDLGTQSDHQRLFKRESDGIEPFVGAIVSPYDTRVRDVASRIVWLSVGQKIDPLGKFRKCIPGCRHIF
jgi:hypothetical protein